MPFLHSLLSYDSVYAAVVKINGAVDPTIPNWLDVSARFGREVYRGAISAGLLKTAGVVGVDFTRKLLTLLTQDDYIVHLPQVQDLFESAVVSFPKLMTVGMTRLFFAVIGVMVREDREACKASICEHITSDVHPTVNRIITAVVKRFRLRPTVESFAELADFTLMVEDTDFKLTITCGGGFERIFLLIAIDGQDSMGVRLRREDLRPGAIESPEKIQRKRKDASTTETRRQRKKLNKHRQAAQVLE